MKICSGRGWAAPSDVVFSTLDIRTVRLVHLRANVSPSDLRIPSYIPHSFLPPSSSKLGSRDKRIVNWFHSSGRTGSGSMLC